MRENSKIHACPFCSETGHIEGDAILQRAGAFASALALHGFLVFVGNMLHAVAGCTCLAREYFDSPDDEDPSDRTRRGEAKDLLSGASKATELLMEGQRIFSLLGRHRPVDLRLCEVAPLMLLFYAWLPNNRFKPDVSDIQESTRTIDASVFLCTHALALTALDPRWTRDQVGSVHVAVESGFVRTAFAFLRGDSSSMQGQALQLLSSVVDFVGGDLTLAEGEGESFAWRLPLLDEDAAQEEGRGDHPAS